MAAGFTLLAFNCSDITRLRVMAIASNLCFIGFGWSGDVTPVLALHLLLLPLNLRRLHQIRTQQQVVHLESVHQTRAATATPPSADPVEASAAPGGECQSRPAFSIASAKACGSVNQASWLPAHSM